MTEEVKEDKKVLEKPKKSIWSSDERKNIPSYGCELMVEDASKEQVNEKNLPTDTMVVTYMVEGKVHLDLCRGPRVNIFDLYYDKFGQGSVQGIDWGHGTINPAQWGYKAPQKKKRRKV
tara:strand:+ start:72 stop:428 length:357 start_codon:yes stop_codon:yes gene_type:complete